METTGTKRLYSKLAGSSACSDASTEPIVEIDAGGDVEADRVSKIAAIEEAHPAQADDDQQLVPVDATWWSEFNASRTQAMSPVLRGGENAQHIYPESYALLTQWYGEEPLVTIPISVVASGQEYEDRVVRASQLIGDVLEDLEGDFWIGSAWKQSISAVEFGRLTLRPVDPSSKAGDLNIRSGDRLIVEPKDSLKVGTMGLTNLGNSCYMNSSLQCLVHVKELAAFFVSGEYRKDINKSNPIGYGGNVAEAFAELCRHLYCDHLGAFSPSAFKTTMGRFNRAFAGYIQQDSQEFTAFLLDSLHEDLNRVIDKPSTEKPELPDEKVADPDAIRELADQCWELHRKRNDSIILDLFTGLYKSTLVCPDCNKVSVTFDPFSDLTLPLPSSNVWVHKVTVVPASGGIKQLEVALDPFVNVLKLKEQAAELLGLKADKLVAGDIYDSQFYSIHDDNSIVSDAINASDDVTLYEVDEKTPVAVYNRSLRCFGVPFLITVTGNESVDDLRALVDARYEQLVQKPVPAYKLSKRRGNNRALEATFSTSFYDLESLDEEPPVEVPPSPQSLEEEEEEDVDMMSASSISSLSGPVSSPEESFVNVKSGEDSTSVSTQRPEASAEPRQVVSPGDVLVVQFEDEFDFADPVVVENPAAVEAQSRKIKQTTLDDCLKAFEKPEVLGENDFWYCSRCKELRQATKQIELWSAPEILTVHLKRFSSFQSFRDKINDVVTFPITGLEMTSRVKGSEKELIYDLIAVDNHYGGLGGGHYTAYAKNESDNTWYYYDDSSVTVADPEQAITGAAYLLFYRRRYSAPLGSVKPETLEKAIEVVTQTRQEIREAQRRPPQLPPRPLSPQEPLHPRLQALTPEQDCTLDLESDELPGWTDIDRDEGGEVRDPSDSDAGERTKLSIEDESSEEI